MKKNKRKWIVLLLATSCLLVVVLGSLAYFTAETRTRNVITTGGVSVEVAEYADAEKTKPFPPEGVTGVMPGASVTKIAEVRNTGASPAWVRVKVEKKITLAEGVTGTPDESLVTLDLDLSAWTEQDGWYYYGEPLRPGEATPPLFTTVGFAASMQNVYQNSTAEVTVTAQAVQTANNGSSALSAAGWPAGGTTGGDRP